MDFEKFSVDINLIKELTSAFGVSGYECEVRDVIKKNLDGVCDISCDKIGNLIAVKKSDKENAKTIMLTANMDESGFIISRIKSGGGAFLDFSAVGSIRPHTVLSKSVVVGEEKIDGVISLKAVHLTTKSEREKPIKLSDLFIDIGADSEEEVLEKVKIGDYAGFKSRFKRLGENAVCDKALDSRACIAVMISVLKSIDADLNIVCVFSAQKEVGVRGSMIDFSFYTSFEPDVCLCLSAIEDESVKSGYGVVMPSMINETMADREVLKKLKEISNSKNECVIKKNDSDIKRMSVKNSGIVCAEIDLPAKNLSTSSVIVDMRDINHMYRVISEYILDCEK